MTRTLARLFLTLAFVLSASLVQAQNKGFCWLVESGQGKAYVYGSLHFGLPEMYPLPAQVERAFAESDTLVVELDPQADPKGLQQALLRQGLYPLGETLEDHLSDQAKQAFADAGIDYRTYNIMRPWMAMLTIQVSKLMRQGYNPEMGLDVHFIEQAKARLMPIKELETGEEQFRMLAELTGEDEDLFIRWSLLELTDVSRQIDLLTEAWINGDERELERVSMGWLFLRLMFSELYEIIYFERNERMADALWEFMAQPETHFMVVGAGHVVGKRGIIALLKARGCRVTRL